MLIPNARGYLLAVTLFLVCCWVNPNDAIPHRAHPHAEEQIDQRADNGAELSGANVTHRDFGHPVLPADKEPALSGGGRKLRSSQRHRSPRSRIKNVNVNVNSNTREKTDKSVTRLSKIKYATGTTSRIPEMDQSTEFTKNLPNIDHSTESTSLSKLAGIHYSTESISRSPEINDSDEIRSSTTLPKVEFSGRSTNLTELSEILYSTESSNRGLETDDSTVTASTTELSGIDVVDESLSGILEIGNSEYTSTPRLPEIDQSTDTNGPPRLSKIADTTKLISQSSNTGHSTDDLNKTKQFSTKSSISPITDDHDLSKISMEPLAAEATNCSESHNENDRYSSSFDGNSTTRSLNVSDDFQVSGDAETERTSSVHGGEDITLCWIETTTIKEDRSFNPVQRLVLREYTISFENSATIHQRYLECVQLEGEVDGKNNGFSRSASFEVIDENTQHSRIVNFTTISRTYNLIVWQHRRVRCGVGPVVTKNIIEWAGNDSNNPKKRVEIKISPRMHRLSAQPTETEPYTMDFADPQLTSTTPAIPSSSVDCGDGTACRDYSDCVDEWCGDSTILNGGSTRLMHEKQTTESFVTTSVNEKVMSQSTTATDDYPSTERLSTPTESISVPSVLLINEPHTHEEIRDYEMMIPWISEEFDFNTSETDKSCESGDSCTDFSFEGATASEEDFSDNDIIISDADTQGDGETSSTEEFAIRPSIDASSDQIMELTTDDDIEYLFFEEWDTTTETREFVEIPTTAPSEHITPKIDINTTQASITGASSMRAYTTNETLTTVLTTEMSTGEETTTQELPSTSCESRENCVFSFEDENLKKVHVPDGSLVKECDDGNETLSCKPVSIASERTTEIMEMGTGDRMERTTDGSATSSGEMTTEAATTSIGNVTTEEITLSTILDDETTTKETVNDTTGGTTEVMVSTAILRGKTTVQESTTGSNTAITETTTPFLTLSGESATEGTTSSSVGVTEMRALLITLGGKSTTQDTTTIMSDATTEVEDTSTFSTITLGGKTTTEETTTVLTEMRTMSTTIGSETTTGMSEAATEKPTTEGANTVISELRTISTTIGSETTTGISEATTEEPTTEETNTVITELRTMSTTIGSETTTGVSAAVTEVEQRDRSEITVFSIEVYSAESTTEVSDATHETTFHTADVSVEETTGTGLRTVVEESDLGTITETIPEFTTDGEAGAAYTTSDVNVEMSTHKIDESTNATGRESVTVSGYHETTTVYSITSSTQMETTTKVPSCDVSTGECDTAQTLAVTPVTLSPCDPEKEGCDSKSDNTTSSCDAESDNCSIESSYISTISCDEESDDCFIGSASISTTNCDDESGDCISDSLSKSIAACDEDSSFSCIPISGIERYSTSADSSELCDDDVMENCMERMKPRDPIKLPPTSTRNEIENVSTTVSDVPTTVDGRKSTTVKAMSLDSKSQHKLSLKIQILLEHIDDNKNKQKLVEVEKHLLFNENPNEHGQHSLMNQVRALNNTISMQTVQVLFNCSTVEKLTGDVGAFAAKYFATHDGIQNVDGHNNSINSSEDLHMRKQRDLTPLENSDFDPNVEMSLPGIHADIHSGLTHVMTRVPSEHRVQKRSAKASKERIPRSRILEVVVDPWDKRLHTRRKRQTIEDLGIDQLDLPKDIEEAGHWSDERVKRAANGGHVRTLAEFTIYKSP